MKKRKSEKELNAQPRRGGLENFTSHQLWRFFFFFYFFEERLTEQGNQRELSKTQTALRDNKIKKKKRDRVSNSRLALFFFFFFFNHEAVKDETRAQRFAKWSWKTDSRDVLQNENCNFRKGPGTRCEKIGACSRISTRKFVWTAFFANKIFVSRSDFREVNPVVQLVQNGGSVGSFRSTGFASIFFFCNRDLDFGVVQLINIWTLVSGMCRMAFWTCCSSRRQSSQFELAMDLILRLRIGRAAHQLFFVDVTVFMREQSEKTRRSAKILHHNRTRNNPNSWPQTVQTTRLGCRTDWSELHTQAAARANDMINSSIEQKLQFSVCKTTRRFAGPSLLSCGLKPSFTKICIRISFCKTSLVSHFFLLLSQA